MKNLVLIGFVVAGAMACSSSGEEELQEAVAASEETENEAAKPEEEKTAEAKTSEESKKEAHSESEMALIDAQATVATGKAENNEEKKEEAAEEKTAEVKKSEEIVYPTTSLLNLRQGPGMSHNVARVASFGEGIALTGETQGLWLKTADGLWVSKGFIAAEKPEKAVDPEMPKAAPSDAVSEVTQPQEANTNPAIDAE
ncbi:MAG: SH3 domain-containing protein [Oligoflexus sp.]